MLEVSHQHPQLRPSARIGVWCATKLATDADGWRQINRGGHPMMWPIFWPDDVEFTNPADTRQPSEDFDAVGKSIGDKISAVVAASGTSGDPQGYGQTVARSCSQTSCTTWLGRLQPTASLPATAGRWRTTHPK